MHRFSPLSREESSQGPATCNSLLHGFLVVAKWSALVFLIASLGIFAYGQAAQNNSDPQATHAVPPDTAGVTLTLPPGFSAAVVAEGVGPARHIAMRANGDMYISTRGAAAGGGIIAIRLGPDHKVATIQRFGTVTTGTGIGFYRGFLYAASPDAVYRFKFDGDNLLPDAQPDVVVSGMPATGFLNRNIAFDGRGSLYISVGGTGNICTEKGSEKGIEPCPSLTGRSGIWRFDANRLNQKFPQDGEQLATGIRDLNALAWSTQDRSLYGIMEGRNATANLFPHLVSVEEDENGIAEEMFRVTKGTNFGWPYTYFDSILGHRVLAPEYGGDGVKPPPTGSYSTPVATFLAHSSPLDLLFYNAIAFPKQYRGGAFIVMHGGSGPDLPGGHHGYQVLFAPVHKDGSVGSYTVFADGFAGDTLLDRNADRAHFRPAGEAVSADGSLYIVDSQVGRLWRITYQQPAQ
jgi:glucose/arabinose dehydrogenase